MQISGGPLYRLLPCAMLLVSGFISGCSLMHNERLVYSQHNSRIGIEADPTVSRSRPPAFNNHPAELAPAEIASLLQVVRVSGWSGTFVGILAAPRPIPVFSQKELSTVADYLAVAFHEATPTERVFFSLPKPEVAYSEDRTAGALFFRGRYLHVVVTDHSSFLQADTAGGDVKDIRDTKGMKLWIAGPAQAATVPDLEEPQWAPFETVHISLNIKEVLAQQQVRESTGSSLEMRRSLEDQNKRIEQLTTEVEQLRNELEKTKSKNQPPRKPSGQ